MRSELLSAEDARQREGYIPWFLPIESENTEMDEAKEVRHLLVEKRLAPFDSKVDDLLA